MIVNQAKEKEGEWWQNQYRKALLQINAGQEMLTL